MKIKEFIIKLQALSDKQKKIILWTVVAILLLIMGYFWIRNTMNSLQKLGESISQIKLPEIQIPADQIADFPVQSQQATEGWKTYTNEKYGFEIKYPKDWSVVEDLANKKFLISNKKPNYPTLILQVLNKNYLEALADEEKIFNEWQKENPEQPSGKTNDIIFSGTPAKEFLYYSPIGSINQTIIASKGDLIISIFSYKNSSLDPILSTFKFIK